MQKNYKERIWKKDNLGLRLEIQLLLAEDLNLIEKD
jgi:hypothetical protein